MKVLGIRCSNNDYTYCILSGTQEIPKVKILRQVAFPANFSAAEALRWFHHEMQEVFNGWNVEAVGIKKPETTVKRSNSLEMRIQNEAIVTLTAAEKGCMVVSRKVKSTMAKDLGLKGKGKYLETKLDTTAFEGFEQFPPKKKEAILVAWSCMK